jgi:glucose/arabinose dehydrogenase/mono/diheme cytochrome c family protein
MRRIPRDWMRLLAFSLTLFPLSLAGATDSPVIVAFTTEEIHLDGKADEESWAHASAVQDWGQPWATPDRRSSASTVRMLWGRESLFVYAQMMDDSVGGQAEHNDTPSHQEDQFELWLRPTRDIDRYYKLAINPKGQTQFVVYPSSRIGELETVRTFVSAEVDRHAAATNGESYWSVEIEIPWVELLTTGGRPVRDEQWQFACWRHDRDSQGALEISTTNGVGELDWRQSPDWAQSRSLVFQGPDRMRLLQALGLEGGKPGIQSVVKGSPDPPLPFSVQRVPGTLSLKWPIFIANEPGTHRYIAIEEEAPYGRTQLVRIHQLDDPESVETLIELTDVAYSVCFHPHFETNGYFYLGSNGKRGTGPVMSRVTQYQLARDSNSTFLPESEKVILEWASNGHNGAAICFGTDGMLYVSTGDGTSDSDRNIVGQGLDHLLGKVLRIDVDHPSNGLPYSIPKDNPFVQRAGARGETWAYGLRNPWRMTSDPKSGHLWVGNNGQDLWEQIYLVKPGANYGWSVYEGSHLFYANREVGPDPIQKPTLEHHHSEARSLTGGVVYYGQRWPELRGAYLYGDYSTGRIWAAKARPDGTLEWQRPIADTSLQITSFSLDADGELLITDHQASPQGGLFTLCRNPTDSQTDSFPETLSDTGLFADISRHEMVSGVLPYEVNSPLWSDGAFKARYIALPKNHPTAEVPKIQYRERGTWGLPEGTVLVKSFGLELTPGEPTSRRWIETRLMVLQQGEWAGYSYRWNTEQTDGTLVQSEGLDKTFEFQSTPKKTLKWHYPSRTECMVCHSRAAGFVLGLSTAQLNRDLMYSHDLSVNQIEAFEQLDLLQIDWRAAVPELIRRQESGLARSTPQSSETQDRSDLTWPEGANALSSLLPVPVEALPRLSNPYDSDSPIGARARSYLQTNCAHCHVEAGGGNAQIDLAATTPLGKMKLIDVEPLHHRFGLEAARLVDPGHPENSVLLHRMASRGNGQMPQLATNWVDTQAVDLIETWIRQLGNHAKEDDQAK